ncbi:hypothetical protein AMECASPLE_027841 [Ameca splendens]|uniref:Uncharacterized protein n=1 Tax=Ameca splendens TaxID=208324 RepID=A0ABV0XU67_9TELE
MLAFMQLQMGYKSQSNSLPADAVYVKEIYFQPRTSDPCLSGRESSSSVKTFNSSTAMSNTVISFLITGSLYSDKYPSDCLPQLHTSDLTEAREQTDVCPSATGITVTFTVAT